MYGIYLSPKQFSFIFCDNEQQESRLSAVYILINKQLELKTFLFRLETHEK